MSLRRSICKVKRQVSSAFSAVPGRLAPRAWYTYTPSLCTVSARRWTSHTTLDPLVNKHSPNVGTSSKFDALITKASSELAPNDASRFRRHLATVSNVQDDSEKVLAALARMASAGEIHLVERLLSLAEEDLGFIIDAGVHTIILQSLLDSRYFLHALLWMQDMPRKPGAVVPSIHRWNDFLALAIAGRHRILFWGAVNYIHDTRVITPNQETYMLIFRTLFQNRKNPVPFASVQKWLGRMKRNNVPFSRQLFEVIVNGYSQEGAYGMVAMIERVYRSAVQSKSKWVGQEGDGEVAVGEDEGRSTTSPRAPEEIEVPQESDASQDEVQRTFQEMYQSRLVETLSTQGDRAAVKEYRLLCRRGFKPTTATLEAMARCLSNASSLIHWENILEIKAEPAAWAIVIRNAAEGPTPGPALQTYRRFLQAGHTPTAAALHPVLRAYCSSKLRPPTESDLKLALKLYDDYIRVVKQRAEAGMTPLSQDDAPLYNTLLRAIASSEGTSFYPAAASLMEDMQARGISMDPMTTASSMILFMRLAPSPEEALSAYKVLRQRPDGSCALDQEGFSAVLAAFCKIALNEPNAYAYFMEITRDMRNAKCHINSQVYTVLLGRLAALASAARERGDSTQSIAEIIRRVHNSITVEASLTPDIALWNQLMDAYQRSGCFREALSVWQSIWISRQFDNASVSIILDACSFAGAYDYAVGIFVRLRAAGFKLNQRNWNNWVECLCRLDRLDEALKVFCVTMPQEEGVRPTVDVARLLQRFAKSQSREGEISNTIKRFLPELYAQMYPT